VLKNSVRIHDVLVEKRDVGTASEKIERSEQMIDDYRKMITEYLLTLSQQTLSHEEAVKVGNYMTCAHNLEKYADYVFNSARNYAKLKENNLQISQQARETLQQLADEIEAFYEQAILLLKDIEQIDEEAHMKDAEHTKRRLKEKIRDAKLEHFRRLQEKTCQSESSMYFVELLSNLDGMVSQVFNISETLCGCKFS
jgi:phosphate:Na+ symporter